MELISAEEVARRLPYPALIEALRHGFRQDIATPVRHQHQTSAITTLLLMPAWSQDYTGLKTVTFKPDNPSLGYPTIQASYLLIDNRTATPLAMMDGTELTRRRTAAASALAADYLARKNASTLSLFGAGALALHFVLAHASVRPIRTVHVVNRDPARADDLVKQLHRLGFEAFVTAPETAVAAADIVSCVTSSTVALVKGAWLKPGTHVDLAGAFKPSMRETDGDVVARSDVYVDTRHGAEAEAGDLLQARDEGKFTFADMKGELADLCGAHICGRSDESAITLFKSCGTALEDLVAAQMVHLHKAT